MGDVFKGAGLVVGNLEGSVGDPRGCAQPAEFCFADDPATLKFLARAGFTAMGVANNHSGDLGGAGRAATRAALAANGIAALGGADSPGFIRVGDHSVAVVTLSLVPARDGVVDAVPSWQVARQMRLARALADWVIVYVHWGKELADWVVPAQDAQAKWLIAQGASVIIGAHPHVVQAPRCVDGVPVFYSLGNHVFDQKYEATKRGLIAQCDIAGNWLRCGGLTTETPRGSSFPHLSGRLGDAGLAACAVPAAAGLRSGDLSLRAWTAGRNMATATVVLRGRTGDAEWRTVPRGLLGAELGTLVPGKAAMLFTLERHPSSMDSEDGPRPYVYDVTPRGLVARWRGSALAWPLLDARLITDASGRADVCALHRGDSFIVMNPGHPSPPRVQVYAWNGFGFSGVADPALTAQCRTLFADARIAR